MRIKYFWLVLIAIIAFSTVNAQEHVIQSGNTYYLANKIVIKLKDKLYKQSYSPLTIQNRVKGMLSEYGAQNVKNRFNVSSTSKKTENLRKIMEVEITSPHDPKVLAKKVSKYSAVEWAEPYYLDQIQYTPNDPNLSSQWYLQKIQAESAWDVTKGDSTIVIATNDTGVDWDHPDLKANIYLNPGEDAWSDPLEPSTGNGIDDDGNGMVDDWRGWDFGGEDGTPDNNPMEDKPDHGSHVAGLSAAVTDNNTGIASIGFNSSIMPVKTSRDDVRDDLGNALVYYGYSGIVYAVENGADIINCSWGGYGFSRAAQDVIDYAVANDVLIVAAAGNSGSSDIFYPASYDGVLSVAATNQSDDKASFSNYGEKIDVSAPGVGIQSTWQNDTYYTMRGTSMASPIVAGLAALVMSEFPNYNSLQIGEQIRVTSDKIDDENPNYENLLGFGRVNAYNAVSETNTKSVRGVNFTFEEEGESNNVFEPGETILISGTFTNYLSATSGLSISLESKNQDVSVNNSTFNAGSFGTMATFNNNDNKFAVELSENIDYNTRVKLLLTYEDGDYVDYQWISFLANPSYNTVNGNDISLTVASDGALAFNDYPGNTQGEGFKYDDGPNLLFEGAFMYGTDANHLNDAARNSTSEEQEDDFKVLEPFVLEVPGETADYQGKASFNDDNAGSAGLGLTTILQTYAYVQEPDNKYIILEYTLANRNDEPVNDVYAGLFFDWDIDADTYDSNKVAYNDDHNFGYAFNKGLTQIDTYVAAALISSDDYGFYAIDNDGSGGSEEIYGGFTNTEKYNMISGGISRKNAGPNDISFVVSGGPFDLAANDYIGVAFAVAASDNFDELTAAIEQSRTKYSEIVTGIPDDNEEILGDYSLAQNYPNPFNPSTKIEFAVPERSRVTLSVYDVLGRKVATLVDAVKEKGKHEVDFNPGRNNLNLSSGVYFYKIKAGSFSNTKKMIYLR